MDPNNKKIIISVRFRDVKYDFSQYSPYGDGKCFEAYQLLLEKNSEVFADIDFLLFLKSISVEEDGEHEFFFEEQDFFDFNSVFGNDNFNDWIESRENKSQFINQLIQKMDNKHIIRKHNTEEIYVVPLLSDDSYNDENVKYTEKLIAALKQDGDDLWLLLHDKDLYSNKESYHPADISEFNNEHVVYNCVELKTLIENNKVFTFIHQDSDPFYSEVINKLDELTLDEIIKELEKCKRVEFAKDVAKNVAKNIRKEDMVNALENASETYDFSKDFLKL